MIYAIRQNGNIRTLIELPNPEGRTWGEGMMGEDGSLKG